MLKSKKAKRVMLTALFSAAALIAIFIVIRARERLGFNTLSVITLILSLLHLGIVIGGFAVKNKRNVFSYWRYGSTDLIRLEEQGYWRRKK